MGAQSARASRALQTAATPNFIARRPALAPALALCLLVAGCADPRSVVALPVAAGLDAAEEELAAHLADLVAGARSLPRSGPLRGRLAMAYHANGFADAAIASYAQAAALDPGDSRWPYLRALLLAESGDLDGAIAGLDRAIAIDPQRPSAWLWRGTWLLDAGRAGDAEAAFRQALAIAGTDAHRLPAKVGLARALLRAGRVDAAIALLEPLTAEFAHPYPMRLLGQGYRRLGRIEDADRAAAGSIRAEPLAWPDPINDAVAEQVRGFSGRLSRAERLIDQGRPTAARAILEPLRALRPDDRVLLNNLAAAYGRSGRPAAALEVLRHGIAKHPDYYLFHYNIASVFEELGDQAAALRHFDRAIDAQPPFLAAHEEKIALLIAQRRYDEALAAIDVAERIGALSPATLFYAGVIAGANERWIQAAQRFAQVLRRNPADAKAQLYRARALAEAQRFDDARAALNMAAALGAPAAAVDAAAGRLATLRAAGR